MKRAPTHSRHYAILNGIFAALLVLVSRNSRVGTINLPVFGLAAFTLSKTVNQEKIASWVRDPFVEENSDHRPVVPAGQGFRYALGELLTCSRCLGAWSALVLMCIQRFRPREAPVIVNLLAISAINDFLQSIFRVTCNLASPADHHLPEHR